MSLKILGMGGMLVLVLLVGCVNIPPPSRDFDSCIDFYNTFDSNPQACDNSTFGCLYANSNLSTLCFCNSTTWVSVSNNSVEC